MQRRTLKLLLTAVAAVLIFIAGAAYWSGLHIERQIAQITAIERFERGWFSSDMSSSLALPNRALPAISLQHDIYHGPLPFIRADTVLDKNSGWCRKLTALCTDEHRLLVSKIGLTGNSYHHFDVPLLQLDTLDGLLRIENLTGELQIPLRTNTPRGSLQTSLADLSWTMSDGRATLKLSDLMLQSSLETVDVYLSSHLALTAEHIAYGPDRAGPGEIRLQADRVNYRLLHQLMLAWQRYRGPSPDFLLLLQELLSQRPKATLARSHLSTPHGELELEGELSLHAVNMFRLLTQPLLLIDTARIDIRIGKALLETIAKRNDKENGAERLADWRQNGLLLLDDDIYHAQLRIREGRMYLNDNVLTLF